MFPAYFDIQALAKNILIMLLGQEASSFTTQLLSIGLFENETTYKVD